MNSFTSHFCDNGKLLTTRTKCKIKPTCSIPGHSAQMAGTSQQPLKLFNKSVEQQIPPEFAPPAMSTHSTDISYLIVEIPWPWFNCQNSQNAPKCSREGAKSHLGSSSRESQKSLSHRPNPVSHRGKLPKKGFRTVQETVLGVSPRRPENTFRTLVKHFCFDSCTRAAES